MRSFRSFTALAEDAFAKPTAVAIGKFDGLHLGHQELLAQLNRVAAENNLEPCVFTFTQHPFSVLLPEKCPPALASTEQRLELLAAAGVSATLIVDFTRELAQMSPDEFVLEVLVRGMHAKAVLVGHDFRFGNKGEGDVALLQKLGTEYGFSVTVVDDVKVDGERVSSTRIRQLMSAGDVVATVEMLGRVPSIRGLVVHGAARGRELGFPTANVEPRYEGFAPAEGIYACTARVRGKEYLAAVSIGSNPTFTPDAPSQVEVHLLDFNDNIYGELITVFFHQRLRGMTTFTGLESLTKQMQLDVEKTRALLGK